MNMKILELSIRIINDRRSKGLKHSRGWANKHLVYFHAEFSKPFKAGIIL